MTAPSVAGIVNRPTDAPLLEVRNLTAFYGDLQALFGITLRVNANMSMRVGPLMPLWLASYLADGGLPRAWQ